MNALRFILPLFAATLPPLALANGPALDARAITAAESLRDQAMQGSSAYDIVESLTTEIGPRMGDSPEYDRATAWAQAKFKTLGSLTRNGQVRYELKTPWRNGTTHVIFEPLEFIFWVGFQVTRPRVNLPAVTIQTNGVVYFVKGPVLAGCCWTDFSYSCHLSDRLELNSSY